MRGLLLSSSRLQWCGLEIGPILIQGQGMRGPVEMEGKINEFQEPLDLRSNPFQGGGNDAILPPKGIG